MVRARIPEGRTVRAYLPNTARLTDILVAEAELVIVPNASEHRRTRWTVTRVRNGTWVCLEAAAASALVAAHLSEGGSLPGWPPVAGIRREVSHGGRRFDLEVTDHAGRRYIVEVKSLSRAIGRTAPLSQTPSARGVAHLGALSELASGGLPAAVVFVVQRGDVDVLDLSAPADPGWAAAVRRARSAGVRVVAYRCEVDERHVRLGGALPVRDQAGPSA